MPCPKCNSTNIRKGGRYKRKIFVIYGTPKHRLICENCNHIFILRTSQYQMRIPIRTRDKIIRLYKTKKEFIGKYDGLKKNTYTIREIAKMLNLSKSYVHSVVKK